MKKIILLLAAVACLISCGQKKKSGPDFTQFEGKYEIDFKTMVDESMGDSKAEKAAKAAAHFMLKRLHVSMAFDGENVTIDASSLAKKFVNKFSEEDKMPFVIAYEIRNDSVLWTFNKDENKLKRAGVLRHEPGNFQRIDLIDEDDDEDEDGFGNVILKKVE